jgi:hypothetical protein
VSGERSFFDNPTAILDTSSAATPVTLDVPGHTAASPALATERYGSKVLLGAADDATPAPSRAIAVPARPRDGLPEVLLRRL